MKVRNAHKNNKRQAFKNAVDSEKSLNHLGKLSFGLNSSSMYFANIENVFHRTRSMPAVS